MSSLSGSHSQLCPTCSHDPVFNIFCFICGGIHAACGDTNLDRPFCRSVTSSHPPLSPSANMPTVWLRITFALLIISLTSGISEGELEQWCVADEQTPDDELQMALDWACGKGGADCSKIQVNQPCYLPNTVKDHASYAFNSYFQKFKNKGGSCYFKGAAIITELDPSHNSCHYEFIP